MPNKSTALSFAKKNKADEFYTQMIDIENEVSHYKVYFENKIVYCSCDSEESNFYKFFKSNFDEYKLKTLFVTGYNQNGQGLFIIKDKTGEKRFNLKGNGDFASQECLDCLGQCDVVCTNPPFSLFNKFIKVIFEHKKDFLIIGNQNSITNDFVFEKIKSNKLWLGFGFKGDAGYFINKNYEDYAVSGNHKEGMIRVSGVTWFTNIRIKGQNKELLLTKEYDPLEYTKYDDFDAINVDKCKDIPINYNEYIGVPITFIKFYDSEKFIIIGLDKNFTENGRKGRFKINGKTKYARIVVKKK